MKPEQRLEIIYNIHIYQSENYVSEKRRVSSTANHSNNERQNPAPNKQWPRKRTKERRRTQNMDGKQNIDKATHTDRSLFQIE